MSRSDNRLPGSGCRGALPAGGLSAPLQDAGGPPASRALALLVCFLPALVLRAGEEAPAADAPRAVAAADWSVAVDGDLNEWGPADCIPLDPADDRVGQRGVFSGWPEHEADVCTSWDAANFYVAVAVTDDHLDAARIPPERRKVRAGGSEKNAMFFYDHLKVFVRGPGEDTGLNLWVSPLPGDGEAYAWGGRQRTEPAAGLPVRAASRARPGVYTYELALPWSWLGLHPFPEMVLDAMFLVTDSDRPRESLHAKIAVDASGREASKWIWWRHRLVLSGEPPGLEPPPPPPEEPESPLERPVSEPAPDLVSARVGDGIARLKARRDSLASAAETAAEAARQAEAAAKTTRARLRKAAGAAAVQDGDAPVETEAQPPGPQGTLESLRRLGARNRTVLAGPPGIEVPPWVEEVERAEGMSAADADTVVTQVLRHLSRLIQQDIAGRTDMFVIDPARSIRTERAKVRMFLRGLTARAQQEIEEPDGRLRPAVDAAAAACGIEPAAAARLLGEILAAGRKLYREERISTTKDLVKKARKKARLDERQADRFLKTLLIW